MALLALFRELISEIIYDAEVIKFGPGEGVEFSLAGADAHLLDIDAEKGEVRLAPAVTRHKVSILSSKRNRRWPYFKPRRSGECDGHRY